jgi:hypothetical protein
MKTNNSIPFQILNNAVSTWSHLFVIIIVYSGFYALLRVTGYSEFTGYVISSMFVIAGIVIPNIYLSAQNSMFSKFAFITKFIFIPSVISGGFFVGISPLGIATTKQLFNFILGHTLSSFLISLFLIIFFLLVAFSLFIGVRKYYKGLRSKTITHSLVQVEFSYGKTTEKYFLNLLESNDIRIKAKPELFYVLRTRFVRDKIFIEFSQDSSYAASITRIISVNGHPIKISDVYKKDIEFKEVGKFNFKIRVN